MPLGKRDLGHIQVSVLPWPANTEQLQTSAQRSRRCWGRHAGDDQRWHALQQACSATLPIVRACRIQLNPFKGSAMYVLSHIGCILHHQLQNSSRCRAHVVMMACPTATGGVIMPNSVRGFTHGHKYVQAINVMVRTCS